MEDKTQQPDLDDDSPAEAVAVAPGSGHDPDHAMRLHRVTEFAPPEVGEMIELASVLEVIADRESWRSSSQHRAVCGLSPRKVARDPGPPLRDE